MGIYDRDYMRRSHDSPRPLSSFLLVVIGIITAVVFGLVIAFCHSSNKSEYGSETQAKGSLRLNINTASIEELQTIPNIGPSRARSIVDHRPYESVEDLVRKRALGRKTAEAIAPFVKIDGVSEKLPTPGVRARP